MIRMCNWNNLTKRTQKQNHYWIIARNDYLTTFNNTIYADKDVEYKELKLLNEFGVSLNLSNVFPNGEDINSSYYVDDTYVFHPIKYLKGMVNSIKDKEISFICDCHAAV